MTTGAGRPHRGSVITATADPSPFGGDGPVRVQLRPGDGGLVVVDGERSVTVRPRRAVVGHGSLTLTGSSSSSAPGPLRLRFEPVQTFGTLAQRYAYLYRLGFRDVLVALRDSGVQLRTAPRVRRAAAAFQAQAWVSGLAFLFIELAVFGVPAGVLSALVAGGYTTASPVLTALLVAAFGAFLLLAALVSPAPLLIRRMFEIAGTKDPIRHFDNVVEHREPGTGPSGQVPVFVPGVPVVHTCLLVAACALYAARAHLTMFPRSGDPLPASRPGPLVLPAPSWLDGTAISVAGYASAAYLVTLFVVSVVRWRGDPGHYGIRWATLVGGFLAFAFGQAGAGAAGREPGAQTWLLLLCVLMIVTFTSGKVLLGFTGFCAMAVAVTVGGMGGFQDWRWALVLAPMAVLITAIALRYAPGGARLVPVPVERAGRIRRVTVILGCAAAVLGVLLMVAGPTLITATG